jgi:hypothetical protein
VDAQNGGVDAHNGGLEARNGAGEGLLTSVRRFANFDEEQDPDLDPNHSKKSDTATIRV